MKMNKKGITLVEVIVVLIIMAVLAGILVASYTGYIDKANEDKALVEARAAYLALTTICHELHAGSYAPSAAEDLSIDGDDSDFEICKADIFKLAGITVTGSVAITDVSAADGKVTAMTYTDAAGNKCVLTGTVWQVNPTP